MKMPRMKMPRILMMTAATAVILAIPSTALAATTDSARTSAPASAEMTVGAQQQAASQTAGVAGPTHSPAVRPMTAAQCEAQLELFGYSLNIGRRLTCLIAALKQPNQVAAFNACYAAMLGSGVGLIAAAAACGAAVAD